MKKNLFTGYIGILMALIISIAAKGQLAVSKMPSRKAIPFYMRLVTENVSDPTYYNNNSNANITNITTRAIRHFLINFNEVSHEKWYCTPDMFIAMFTLNDIDYRVDYDKKGNWIETFRTYDETKLSPDIRDIVKSSYYDYKIFQVQEIEQPLHPINYIIHLEGETKLINLRVCNGEIEEWQKFTKSE